VVLNLEVACLLSFFLEIEMYCDDMLDDDVTLPINFVMDIGGFDVNRF